MAVDRQPPARPARPVYRGQHVDEIDEQAVGERTRTILLTVAIGGLGLVLTAAILSPLRGDDAGLPALPARVSPLPLVPVPRQPPPSRGPAAPTPTVEPAPTTPSGTPPRRTSSPWLPAPSLPPVAPISFEAEAAANVLGGDARVRAVAGASGGQVITSVGGAAANSLRFGRISVPFDGVYVVVVHYVSDVDRSVIISVNDGPFIRLDVPGTQAGDRVGALVLRVRLDTGLNSIEFSNPASRAPDIDRIVVSS
ncbi:hypothetical protein ACNTMW_28730 [Planosporangium sp. 12N6]|uniref:hypothetical protein n=1 Tax=Planosporangium spinosum TaxID=3402278 RepID=UPI003CEC40D2